MYSSKSKCLVNLTYSLRSIPSCPLKINFTKLLTVLCHSVYCTLHLQDTVHCTLHQNENTELCLQTFTNFHWRSCLKMIAPAISLKIFEGEIYLFVKQNNLKVLSSTCVKVTANTNISKEQPQRRRQEHPKKTKWCF